MLAPPRGVGAPSSGKSWVRHCIVTELFNIPVNDFDAKKSHCRWVLVVTKLDVSGTQCTLALVYRPEIHFVAWSYHWVPLYHLEMY